MWRSMLFALLFGMVCRSVFAAEVHVLRVAGAIGPATAAYLTAEIESAGETGAAVVIRMDTPGGLDRSMRDIIQAILASRVPVVTYVSPSGARAASAGTYILYASHLAVMAPGTNLGAATPVQLGGALPGSGDETEPSSDGGASDNDHGSAMERKMVNDAVAYIRSLAELRDRNADWAEHAVREAASLSASEAVRQRVVDFVAPDLEALLREGDGRMVETATGKVSLDLADVTVQRRPPDWRNRLLAVITDPNVAYILMLIGIYGLIFELASPGAIVPGVLGGISLLLALFAFQTLPVNYAGFALLLLGIAFMIAEAFVPSFGALGIGGVVAFATGSLLLFDAEAPGFELSLSLVVGVTAASLLVCLGVAFFALRAFRQPVVSGRRGLEGGTGTAADSFTGTGYVRVAGELWRARTSRPIVSGQPVRIVRVEGLTLDVEPVPAGTSGDDVVE